MPNKCRGGGGEGEGGMGMLGIDQAILRGQIKRGGMGGGGGVGWR